ncbi:protocadherin gamma-C5-like isoform X4 [Ambystoma mexicanum]|uniref:protocadherin gamma-C5-like isoform X4 n=1 Tax=Ambystoma mexicanum TaxID=8296 RepID=UPI0037E766C1
MDCRVRKRGLQQRRLLLLISSLSVLGPSSGQTRYSVREGQEPGAFVGSVAKDLGLALAGLAARRLRVVTQGERQYFQVDLASGGLLLHERIDREELCGDSSPCLLHVQLVLENPLSLLRVEVEVVDVNDNAPLFPKNDILLEISELTNTGSALPLEIAEDPDVGTNSVSTYELSASEYFALRTRTRDDGVKVPEIVLDRPLDREQVAAHHLILTAYDSGVPVRSGTASIIVTVIDANDNAPVCEPSFSKISLQENVPAGTLVIRLNVTDLDEGLNGELDYSFKTTQNTPEKIPRLFNLDPGTGEVRTKWEMDFEESSVYDIVVRVRDRGFPKMEGLCHIKVELIDVNDNSPEIILTSVSSPIQEDAPSGTVIALISVKDNDSGKHGEVHLQIQNEIPFQLLSSFRDHYSLVTDGVLDREQIASYNITIEAADSGTPPRATRKYIFLNISDENDNAPTFPKPSYTVHVRENNLPGFSIGTVSASDPDLGENSKVSYLILVQDFSQPTYFHINSENGTIYIMRSLDYEQEKVFMILVEAKDSGSPPLSSTATVHVFVQDENDNSPRVMYPPVDKGSVIHQTIPRTSEPGYLVTKIVAVDADSGHNAWLSYHLQPTPDKGLFTVELRSGEIRITRMPKDLEMFAQRLLVVVKDNGKPPLSTSVTLEVSLEDTKMQESSKIRDLPRTSHTSSDLTLYLIISLAAISLVSLVMFVVLFVRCLKPVNGSTGFACCCKNGNSDSRDALKQPPSNLPGQFNPEGYLKFIEVGGTGLGSETRCYRSCLTPVSEQSDFMFVRPFSHSATGESVNNSDQSVSTLLTPCDGQAQPFQQSQPFQQAPPNTDWRFSQAQRPGTSGSQNSEEAGGWPNNQFETERLQAMILASANEGADGSSTLGGGAGTMGLSTRYGPQFTLQHVPDYRQNVYIPGSTATLTNAAGKRDGKSAAASGGNKKKSGKKEKK